jgi:glycosyltransferase involved in cell wall biosynthesis
MLKIAIIAHLKYAIAEPFAGGLEMHTHLLAKSLRERGHDVTLFASLASDPALGMEAICEETSLLETGLAEAGNVAFFREHHAYLRLMTDLQTRSFDIIHNNSLPLSPADDGCDFACADGHHAAHPAVLLAGKRRQAEPQFEPPRRGFPRRLPICGRVSPLSTVSSPTGSTSIFSPLAHTLPLIAISCGTEGSSRKRDCTSP